jgi:hypothetical protein
MKLTPKEKARELINDFTTINRNSFTAKSNAIRCVNEILENFGNLTEGKDHYCASLTTKYYEDVKQELLTYGRNK